MEHWQPGTGRKNTINRLLQVNEKHGPNARDELKQTSCNLKMTLARDASVFTRIWAIAEIHEAQCKDIKQYFLAHVGFQEYWALWSCCRRRSNAGALLKMIDVNQAEASAESDRSMILERITDRAKYNADVKEIVRSSIAGSKYLYCFGCPVRASWLPSGFLRSEMRYYSCFFVAGCLIAFLSIYAAFSSSL